MEHGQDDEQAYRIVCNSRPAMWVEISSQQTQNICIAYVQRRPNVSDVGPALYKGYTDVLCLLVDWMVRSSPHHPHIPTITWMQALRLGRRAYIHVMCLMCAVCLGWAGLSWAIYHRAANNAVVLLS